MIFNKKKKQENPTGMPLIVIAGTGAVTPVGLDFSMSCTSVTCQVRRMGLCDYFTDFNTGDPLSVSWLKTLPIQQLLPERMTTMARDAANQATAPLKNTKIKVPLLLSTPPSRPGFDQKQGEAVFKEVETALPFDVDKAHSGLYCTGHTGGIEAVIYAALLFMTQRAEVCLVGGVDSYMHMECLDWLNAEGRLKKEDNPFGFFPGEGAGFLLLCTPDFARRQKLESLSVIRSAGVEDEHHPWYSGKATMGKGMTNALSQTFENRGKQGKLADVTFSDFNGESWRATEWEYAYLRTAQFYKSPLDVRHPVECWGDVGAASGPLLIGQAAFEMFYQYDGCTSALVWTASDTQTTRAACLLECDSPSSLLRSKNTL